ncbi:MAG: hypothetical protein HYU55_14935 [Nocardioides sp.]|nr:hypothetical protein [Nocardioides sp.]
MEVVTVTGHHELRWGGFAGLGFVVLAAIAVFLPGLAPMLTDSDREITTWISDSRTQLLASSLLWAAGAGLIIWFASAFAEAIREREERSDVHLALLAGAVLVGGAVFVTAAGQAIMAYGEAGRDPGLTLAMFEGVSVLNSVIGVAATLPLVAAGIGVLRTHLMPDWLGYLALAAAAVSVIGAFGVFFTDGAMVAGGRLSAMIPLLASGIWVACTSAYMVREHLPQMTPMGLPQT